MNRFKFRFWDKEEKKMTNGLGRSQLVIRLSGSITEGSTMTDGILMQWTGFKDCEGVHIYEGDIIEFDRQEWGGDDNIHVVKWDEKAGEWNWGGGSASDMEWRTVIGNIYVTPDLLP